MFLANVLPRLLGQHPLPFSSWRGSKEEIARDSLTVNVLDPCGTHSPDEQPQILILTALLSFCSFHRYAINPIPSQLKFGQSRSPSNARKDYIAYWILLLSKFPCAFFSPLAAALFDLRHENGCQPRACAAIWQHVIRYIFIHRGLMRSRAHGHSVRSRALTCPFLCTRQEWPKKRKQMARHAAGQLGTAQGLSTRFPLPSILYWFVNN